MKNKILVNKKDKGFFCLALYSKDYKIKRKKGREFTVLDANTFENNYLSQINVEG